MVSKVLVSNYILPYEEIGHFRFVLIKEKIKISPRIVPINDIADAKDQLYVSPVVYSESILDYQNNEGKGKVQGFTGDGAICFLWYDIDNGDLEEARKIAIKLINKLIQLFGPEHLRVYFSGSKGFHIYLLLDNFLILSSKKICELHKKIAGDINIDESVYSSIKPIRAPGSRHQTYENRFKILLSIEQLNNLSIEKIINFSESYGINNNLNKLRLDFRGYYDAKGLHIAMVLSFLNEDPASLNYGVNDNSLEKSINYAESKSTDKRFVHIDNWEIFARRYAKENGLITDKLIENENGAGILIHCNGKNHKNKDREASAIIYDSGTFCCKICGIIKPVFDQDGIIDNNLGQKKSKKFNRQLENCKSNILLKTLYLPEIKEELSIYKPGKGPCLNNNYLPFFSDKRIIEYEYEANNKAADSILEHTNGFLCFNAPCGWGKGVLLRYLSVKHKGGILILKERIEDLLGLELSLNLIEYDEFELEEGGLILDNTYKKRKDDPSYTDRMAYLRQYGCSSREFKDLNSVSFKVSIYRELLISEDDITTCQEINNKFVPLAIARFSFRKDLCLLEDAEKANFSSCINCSKYNCRANKKIKTMGTKTRILIATHKAFNYSTKSLIPWYQLHSNENSEIISKENLVDNQTKKPVWVNRDLIVFDEKPEVFGFAEVRIRYEKKNHNSFIIDLIKWVKKIIEPNDQYVEILGDMLEVLKDKLKYSKNHFINNPLYKESSRKISFLKINNTSLLSSNLTNTQYLNKLSSVHIREKIIRFRLNKIKRMLIKNQKELSFETRFKYITEIESLKNIFCNMTQLVEFVMDIHKDSYELIYTNPINKWTGILKKAKGARVVILDGTAHLDPDYKIDGAPNILSIPLAEFPNLTIESFSKKTILKSHADKGMEKDKILELLYKIKNDGSKALVVMSKNEYNKNVDKGKYKDNFPGFEFNYSGNLKGSNKYNKLDKIVLTHIQRYSSAYYLNKARLHFTDEVLLKENFAKQWCEGLSNNVKSGKKKALKSIQQSTPTGVQYRNPKIQELVEYNFVIEMIQTIMRIKLRNNPSEKCTVYLPTSSPSIMDKLSLYFKGANFLESPK